MLQRRIVVVPLMLNDDTQYVRPWKPRASWEIRGRQTSGQHELAHMYNAIASLGRLSDWVTRIDVLQRCSVLPGTYLLYRSQMSITLLSIQWLGQSIARLRKREKQICISAFQIHTPWIPRVSFSRNHPLGIAAIRLHHVCDVSRILIRRRVGQCVIWETDPSLSPIVHLFGFNLYVVVHKKLKKWDVTRKDEVLVLDKSVNESSS